MCSPPRIWMIVVPQPALTLHATILPCRPGLFFLLLFLFNTPCKNIDYNMASFTDSHLGPAGQDELEAEEASSSGPSSLEIDVRPTV